MNTSWMSNPKVLYSAFTLAGAAVGAVGTYFIGLKQVEKRLALEYEKQIEAEMDNLDNYYRMKHKAKEYSTPEKAVKALVEPEPEEEPVDDRASREEYEKKAAKYMNKTEDPESEGLVKVSRNVFTNVPEDEWDQDEENKTRDPNRPYVISYEEYIEQDPKYSQSELTYYEGDNIVADEADEPIDDEDGLYGGDETLRKFGHGSQDPNVVYVRNEKIALEMCITKTGGSFEEAVFGAVRHSSDRHILKKFRGDDE